MQSEGEVLFVVVVYLQVWLNLIGLYTDDFSHYRARCYHLCCEKERVSDIDEYNETNELMPPAPMSKRSSDVGFTSVGEEIGEEITTVNNESYKLTTPRTLARNTFTNEASSENIPWGEEIPDAPLPMGNQPIVEHSRKSKLMHATVQFSDAIQ